jgi:hypothetical protein
MVVLDCDVCHKSWTVPKDKIAEATECPFCHEPAQG